MEALPHQDALRVLARTLPPAPPEAAGSADPLYRLWLHLVAGWLALHVNTAIPAIGMAWHDWYLAGLSPREAVEAASAATPPSTEGDGAVASVADAYVSDERVSPGSRGPIGRTPPQRTA